MIRQPLWLPFFMPRYPAPLKNQQATGERKYDKGKMNQDDDIGGDSV